VVDQAGGHHALNKKLTGLTLAEIRQRLGDLDRPQLPGVGQAQRMQRARSAAQSWTRVAREFLVRRKNRTGGRTGPKAWWRAEAWGTRIPFSVPHFHWKRREP
jgi:hypothetical protein